MSAAKTQKEIWAAPRLIELMRAEMKNTSASGAKITTRLNGLANMKLPNEVSSSPAAPWWTERRSHRPARR